MMGGRFTKIYFVKKIVQNIIFSADRSIRYGANSRQQQDAKTAAADRGIEREQMAAASKALATAGSNASTSPQQPAK